MLKAFSIIKIAIINRALDYFCILLRTIKCQRKKRSLVHTPLIAARWQMFYGRIISFPFVFSNDALGSFQHFSVI